MRHQYLQSQTIKEDAQHNSENDGSFTNYDINNLNDSDQKDHDGNNHSNMFQNHYNKPNLKASKKGDKLK